MVVRLGVGFAALALVVVATSAAAGVFKAPSGHLLPADPTGAGDFGASVAVSADGNTALVGGDRSGSTVAVAVYVRSGSTWTKQAELTPTVPTANAGFGAAVALSADGNTALVGDTGLKTVAECTSDGACSSASGLPSSVWVFTRSGATWTQQGPALSPPSARGVSGFGSSVALSADGNTALVGARLVGHAGAAWVFTRSGSIWKRQGTKLTASDETGRGDFGTSVALSWDGATALIGGPSDTPGTDSAGNATNVGAAWVFTRTGSTWRQQGSKLTGPGGVVPGFGRTVALSADGDTAVIGGDQEGGAPAFYGAVWTFSRVGATWTAVGPKLYVSDPTGDTSGFGSTLALAADGNTALIGGSTAGYREVWEFTRIPTGWKQEAELPTLGGIDFGQTMALTPAGDTAVIGTSDASGPGSAYVFASAGSTVGAPSVSRLVVSGGQATIVGKNLTGAAVVRIGSVTATIIAVSSTKIIATVSASTVSAPVTVITPNGAATSSA
jgi:hypothetical protein